MAVLEAERTALKALLIVWVCRPHHDKSVAELFTTLDSFGTLIFRGKSKIGCAELEGILRR